MQGIIAKGQAGESQLELRLSLLPQDIEPYYCGVIQTFMLELRLSLLPQDIVPYGSPVQHLRDICRVACVPHH